MGGVTVPTMERIVDVIVRLLAQDRGEPEADIRDELLEGGWEMPIDSLLLMAILAAVEDEFGVEVPPDENTARSMRSVHAFADAVLTACITGDRSTTP